MKNDIDLTFDLNDQVYDAIENAKNLYDNLLCADILSGDYNDQAIIEIAKMVLSLQK